MTTLGFDPTGATVYGLDIETDTTAGGGLDPSNARVVAVAVAGESWHQVLEGAEDQLLCDLDAALSELDPGVIVTWNGARFDLPFLADRARACDVYWGLVLTPDEQRTSHRDPLPGHVGGYRASWHDHRHLDAYQVYRADVGASLGLPCGLKQLSRFVGLHPVEVDRTKIHALSQHELAEYVASDAILTRELALRRWSTARLAIDQVSSS